MSKRLFKGKDIIGNWYSGNMSVLEKDLHMGSGIIRQVVISQIHVEALLHTR